MNYQQCFNKGKRAILPLYYCREVLSSASYKATFFADIFSDNYYLVDSAISLPSLSTRTYVKLRSIPATPKMVKNG